MCVCVCVCVCVWVCVFGDIRTIHNIHIKIKTLYKHDTIVNKIKDTYGFHGEMGLLRGVPAASSCSFRRY